MSRLKTRRADDYPIPVSVATAIEKPPATSPEQLAKLLKLHKYSKVIPELNNLVVRAESRDKLDIAVIKARESAARNGFIKIEGIKKRPPNRTISTQGNFEFCRKRAVERVRKRKEIEDRPKASCMIGSKFGRWETLTDTFYDEPFLPGVKRAAKVKVKCECGSLDTKTLSALKQGRTRECVDCTVQTRKGRYRSKR